MLNVLLRGITSIVPQCLHYLQGEISLRGRITAVGGIKEKLIGALRAGVKTVLLPSQNKKDVKDLPKEVKDGLQIILVRYVMYFLSFFLDLVEPL